MRPAITAKNGASLIADRAEKVVETTSGNLLECTTVRSVYIVGRKDDFRPGEKRAPRGTRAQDADGLEPAAGKAGQRYHPIFPYAGSLAMVAAAFAVGFALRHLIGISDIALVFLTAVLASAVSYGLWPSLFASLASVLAYDFFFLPPIYSLLIADPENVVTLITFVIVAVIVSNLAARVRAQALAARQHARTTEDLYLFARALAGIADLDELLRATARQIALMLDRRALLLLPQDDWIVLRAAYPQDDCLDEAELAAAQWAWLSDRPAGRGTDAVFGVRRLFLPLHTGRGPVGVVGLDSNDPAGTEPLLTADQHRLLQALADQAALAIERHRLAQDVEEGRVAAANEQLRAALLASISHDLRTPLAGILGSATSLKNFRRMFDDATQDELIATIQEEAERLNRFIANLLDMTRLEARAVRPHVEIVDLGDLVGSALDRARKVLARHHVSVECDKDLPMLQLDPVLFEQVLFNLLDNAAKYAPVGTQIRLSAGRQGDVVRLLITDGGSGIPPEDLKRVFDKFHRVHAADRRRVGTGLGLAICKGFVEAMDGTITAGNRDEGQGAVFTIAFPVPATQTPLPEAAA
jgi:two-component system, OmpR family, sensor histidine kinase KdpD